MQFPVEHYAEPIADFGIIVCLVALGYGSLGWITVGVLWLALGALLLKVHHQPCRRCTALYGDDTARSVVGGRFEWKRLVAEHRLMVTSKLVICTTVALCSVCFLAGWLSFYAPVAVAGVGHYLVMAPMRYRHERLRLHYVRHPTTDLAAGCDRCDVDTKLREFMKRRTASWLRTWRRD